ncbi:MAG: hypothetical protein IK016_03735 [Lachnospiraceae bacterium]|nr:hypothetical protein [Lachnospiraceae bacterium]
MGRGTGKVAKAAKEIAGMLWEPLPAFNFVLIVEGVMSLSCRRVHSFTKENEFEYIQEGGLNDYVHMRRKQITKPFTFQVERYVHVDSLPDPIELGTELVLPVLLLVYDTSLHGLRSLTPLRTYTFTGCTVMAKEFGELNGEQSGLLVETTTIGYREMMKVTLPMSASQVAPKAFDWLMEKGKPLYAKIPPIKPAVMTTQNVTNENLWGGWDGTTRPVPNLRARTPDTENEVKPHPKDKLWDGFQDPDNPSTKRMNAVPPKKSDANRAANGDDAALWEGWDGVTKPPETTRALRRPVVEQKESVEEEQAAEMEAEMISATRRPAPLPHPNAALWEGWDGTAKPPKGARGRTPEQTEQTAHPNAALWQGLNAELAAQQVTDYMLSPDSTNPPDISFPSTQRLRAVAPKKDDAARAPVVKWPADNRRMMAELLK